MREVVLILSVMVIVSMLILCAIAGHPPEPVPCTPVYVEKPSCDVHIQKLDKVNAEADRLLQELRAVNARFIFETRELEALTREVQTPYYLSNVE